MERENDKCENSRFTVENIPLTVTENNIMDGAREVLQVIRPTWKSDNIRFKLFTDGITNKLIGCFHQPINGHHNPVNNNEEVVLIRVYGNKTDLLIDRKAEVRNIKLLHSLHLAPQLYAVFENGLAYEYVPGVTLTPETVRLPKVWRLVAKRMAAMHKVDCSAIVMGREPVIEAKFNQFLNLVPDQFTNPEIHERVKDQFLPVSRLREECQTLCHTLSGLGSPTVFSHNDLLLGNVIYTEERNSVTFIDYEYADMNYQAFDIGNHFAEFAGIDEVDYSQYPDEQFQKAWLRVYLEAYNEDSADSVTDSDVDRLYNQANKFTLASHLLWTVWALIQAEHSKIDFDFVHFAEVRYNEYLAKKDTFLAL